MADDLKWTAVVPIKGGFERKTRLAPMIDEAGRQRLSDRFFLHVVEELERCPAVAETIVLSDVRPRGWEGRVCIDQGRGLNAELDAVAAQLRPGPLVVVHADLPLLNAGDVGKLLHAASAHGLALAPDRHSRGTNALALVDPSDFSFAFGPDSFAEHRAKWGSGIAVIKSLGLSIDVDTMDDLVLTRSLDANKIREIVDCDEFRFLDLM